MKNDTEGEGEDEWITLPVLMQQFADKQLAKYQLECFEATKRLERNEIKEHKVDAIKRNAVRPLILMHGSGQPATAKYISDHLVKNADGTLTLKDP